ncbi:hypothetical protein ACWDBW_18175 [Streptomyces sp. NPDC001107]
MQEFSPLTDKEREEARKRIPKHIREGALLRCTNKNCRRFQQRGNYRLGGNLPPEDE